MLGGRKITAILTGENLEGSVTKGSPWGGGVNTPVVLPVCKQSHGGTQWERMLYTGVCAMLFSRKFPLSQSFFRRR